MTGLRAAAVELSATAPRTVRAEHLYDLRVLSMVEHWPAAYALPYLDEEC